MRSKVNALTLFTVSRALCHQILLFTNLFWGATSTGSSLRGFAGWQVSRTFHTHVPNGTLPLTRLLYQHHHHDGRANMDRASQVLAQGVPPDVPKPHRALALHKLVARENGRFWRVAHRAKIGPHFAPLTRVEYSS